MFSRGQWDSLANFDILAAVKRTAIPHHATFLGWSRQWGETPYYLWSRFSF
ncbi:MAG: hypothetical protein GPJ17_02910 [Microcystis aeruginosa K13-07]|nr:hypothetical protein [Microcystis aeruginosa K13-07]